VGAIGAGVATGSGSAAAATDSGAVGRAGTSVGTLLGTSTAGRGGATGSGAGSANGGSGGRTSASGIGAGSSTGTSTFLAAGSVWIFFSTLGSTVGRGATAAAALGRPPLEMRTLTASIWSASRLLSWFLTSYPRSRQ